MFAKSNKTNHLIDNNVVLKTFEDFIYSWSQAINFVNEQTKPLKVFKTVKDTSAIGVSQI